MRTTGIALVMELTLVIFSLQLASDTPVSAQDQQPVANHAADNEPVEDAAFTKAADRYWKILSRRPRRGVAFDQWYRLYLDAGKLDQLTARVETHAKEAADDGNAMLLLGMTQERANQSDKAIETYTAASKLAADNYYMSFTLGSLYARQLNYKNAESALKRALELKPPRTDLLEISKQLARIQLRQRNTESAQQTLATLATQFPKDRRVLTELAELLQNENQFDAAIERWQAVSKLVSEDPFEKIRANLAIASIHSQQGKTELAVSELDGLLNQVRPDGWIAGDLRDRIETVFLKTNNREGLLEFCRQRAKTHADEPESLLQLAKTVARFGDADEAISTLQKAMEKVPSNQNIHKALIEQLLKTRDYDGANQQALLLASRHKSDIDALLLAGNTILHRYRDRYELTDEAKKAQEEALSIWKRIADIRPDDASLCVQVANACREAARLKSAAGGLVRSARLRQQYYQKIPMIIGAEKFYRQAVARADDNPEYNEFLGEFLYDVGRVNEAKTTFAKIVPADNATSSAWYRLAGLHRRFRFLDDSVAACRTSIELDGDNYQARDMLVSLLFQKDDYKSVLKELPLLEAAADSEARKDIVLGRYVEAWSAVNEVARAIQQLSLDADDETKSVEVRVRNRKLIAKLFDTQNDVTSAARSLGQALELQPESISLRETYARFLEQADKTSAAIAEYRTLIQQQPQLATRMRLKVVRLLMRQTGSTRSRLTPDPVTGKFPASPIDEFKLILKSLPTNPEELVELSNVATDLRLPNESVDLLRKAVRANPSDVDIRLMLANSLASKRKDHDAMEHYRHCLELTDEIKGRMQIVNSMATVAKEGRFTKQLIDELRNLPLEPREQGLLLAEALVVAGRSADATKELEAILLRDSQDAFVMNRLADVWSGRKLWQQAVRQRERVAKLTNDPEILKQLAIDYERAQEYDGLARVMTTLVSDFGQGEYVARRMDATLRSGNLVLAGRLAEALYAEAVADGNVDLLYRVALAYLPRGEKRTDAFEMFRGIAESTESAPIPPASTAAKRSVSVTMTNYNRSYRSTSLQVPQVVNTDVFANVGSSPVFESFHEVEKLRAAFEMLKSGSGAGQANPVQARLRTNRVTSMGRSVTVMDALQQPDSRHAMWKRSLAAMRVLDHVACGEWITKQAKDNKRYGEYGLLSSIAGTRPGVDLINKHLATYPNDPIPRLAMFMSRVTPPKEAKDLDVMKQTVKDSYAWLKTNQPETATELIMNYAVQMDLLGDSTESAKVIGQAAEKANDMNAWMAVLGLLQNFSDTKLRQDVLEHVETYCKKTTTPAVEVYSLLNTELSDPAVTEDAERFSELVLPLIGYCFERANNSSVNQTNSRYPPVLLAEYQRAAAEMAKLKRDVARLKAIPPATATPTDKRNLAKAEQQLKVIESRRNVLLQQLSASSRTIRVGTTTANVNGFPSACSLMSSNEVSWMQQSVTQFRDAAWKKAFIEWAAKKAADSEQPQRYQLLGVYAHWWFGEQSLALSELKTLAHDRKDDIRLLESEALHASGEAALALASMNWMEDATIDKKLRARAVTRRSEILKLVCSQTDYVQMAECLKLELNSFTRPALESFFVRRGVQRVNASNVSVSPIYAGPMVNLLDHITDSAAATDQLATLETAATRRLKQYPQDAQLGALTALLRERQGRPEDGLEPLKIWKQYRQPAAKMTIPTWRDPITGRMLALAFARHDKTRRTALEIVAERLIADAAGSSVAMRVLLGDVTRRRDVKSAVPKSKTVRELNAELAAATQLLKSARSRARVTTPNMAATEKTIESIKKQLADRNRDAPSSEFDLAVIKQFMEVLYEKIDNQPRFERLVAARRMMQCMPTPMVPQATKMMTKLLVSKSDEWEDKNNIIRSVHEAVERAESELNDSERDELLQVVHDMVFVNGDQKMAQPLAWEEKSGRRVRRGAIADMLIKVAARNGELKALRQKWDDHPLAKDPTMVLLRLEAAAAADDDIAADKLIREFRSLPEADQSIAPWSSILRAPLEPDSWVGEWVLQRGGRLWIDPGERVFTLDQIPTYDYHVTRVMIAGTGFPSEFVADLQGEAKATNLFLRTASQLEKLESLQILYMPVTDRQVRHLSSCKSLVDLKLENALITDAAVDILSTIKSLKVLVLRDTNVTDDGVARLRKALPNCEVDVE